MKSYLDGLRRYFEFSGRSTRSQFWLFVLVYFIILVVATFIDQSVLRSAGEFGWLSRIVVLAHFFPYLAVLVRRLHDSDRSAWWLLLCWIPLVAIIFACIPSTPGPNRFGAFPGAPRDGMGSNPSAGRVEPGMTTAAPVQELEKLAALRQSGAIDEQEYQRMKNRLLGPAAG